jgi:hypothetical protein
VEPPSRLSRESLTTNPEASSLPRRAGLCMPEFSFEVDDVYAILAYLTSIQEKGR